MRNKGFTLVELVIVLSIMVILTPIVYGFYRSYEVEYLRSLTLVEAARAMRTVSEEIRRDLQSLQLGGEGGVVLSGRECPRVEYLVEDRVLLRRASAACGGDRGLARNVLSLRRDGREVTIEFGRQVRPGLSRGTTLRMVL